MELGKKIKQLRLHAGLTQEQLANTLGISPQSVSKWETAVAMPDITLLPNLAETFGVSIDDLFDLSAAQRLSRIEHRLDLEEELPREVYWEYEEFLKAQLSSAPYKKRATELIAYLYWHRMHADAQKVQRYAKEAIRLAPGEKGCQWMLNLAEGHAIWDWNLGNHQNAIDFYGELVEQHPDVCMPRYYLLDNLLADHRADEAERHLAELSRLPAANPALLEAYRAQIALARFDEPTADRIMEQLIEAHPTDTDSLFEAAQYYAKKCDYPKAVALYERAYETDPKRPRYIDALMAIAVIHEMNGEYRLAADTCDRIIDLQRHEWGMTEETELKVSIDKRNQLLSRL